MDTMAKTTIDMPLVASRSWAYWGDDKAVVARITATWRKETVIKWAGMGRRELLDNLYALESTRWGASLYQRGMQARMIRGILRRRELVDADF